MPSAWGNSWGAWWGNAWGTITSGGGGGGGGGGGVTPAGTLTARDLIKRALRRLEVIAAGEEPTAEEARDALLELNAMMVGFPAEGIAYTHTMLALSDVVNMDNGRAIFVSNMLTEKLAGEYGRSLTPVQLQEAETARRMLQAAYFTADTATLDYAIWRPSSWRFRGGGT